MEHVFAFYCRYLFLKKIKKKEKKKGKRSKHSNVASVVFCSYIKMCSAVIIVQKMSL